MSGILFLAIIAIAIYLLSQNFIQSSDGGFELRAYEEGKYLVSLLAKVAKSDGHVSELEAQLISETLDDIAIRLGGDMVKRAELKLIFGREKQNLENAYDVAREYCDRFNLSHDAATARMSVLLNLAYIDGVLNADERRVITQIALGLRLNGATLNALFARFDEYYAGLNSQRHRYRQSRQDQNSQNSSDRGWSYNQANSSANLREISPYAVLELSEGAPFSEVKKRYRELVKKYHPDLLMGRGESEEIIERSTRKLQEINEAYEAIKEKS